MLGISQFTTKDLVEELKKREGINYIIVEPYIDYEVIINKKSSIMGSGPSILLEITD